MVLSNDGRASFSHDSPEAVVEAPSGLMVTREVNWRPLQYFLLLDSLDFSPVQILGDFFLLIFI